MPTELMTAADLYDSAVVLAGVGLVAPGMAWAYERHDGARVRWAERRRRASDTRAWIRRQETIRRIALSLNMPRELFASGEPGTVDNPSDPSPRPRRAR